jgi:hypothetical protein
MAVADALNIPSARRYAWKNRDRRGLLVPEVGRAEAARIGSWLVDDWRPSETYVGKYVVASPHLQEPRSVVGRVCDALRQLADAVRASQVTEDGDAQDGDAPSTTPPFDVERYRAMIERLVRPGEARFREALFDAFGGRCVITGCAVPVALEAAHIRPLWDSGSDGLENGLLLRTDLQRCARSRPRRHASSPSSSLSSSPEGSLPRGPRQIRTRRFPPSGSSADVARDYGPQMRTAIRGRGSSHRCLSSMVYRCQLRRLRWLRRHSHLCQPFATASAKLSKLRKLPLTPK